jgi:hypothetical protein
MCCHCINRREFLGVTAGMAAGAALVMPALAKAGSESKWQEAFWDPDRPFLRMGRPLRVQPILMYRLSKPREMTSWKSWGGVQTEPAVTNEVHRIAGELNGLAGRAEFPMEILPVARVTSTEEAAQARAVESDVTILYPATGSGDLLNACIPERGALVFVRHQSGPVYYWYEALSVRFLKTDKDGPDSGNRVSVHDVVVDDPQELLWRLRALFSVKNFIGSRVVAIGGPQGKYAQDAPAVARERFKLDIVEVSYEDLGKRIAGTLADTKKMACANRWTEKYLALPQTVLETDRGFVVNAFALYGIFHEVMSEADAEILTINQCMSTILPMSKTTACLTLSLLNDEGFAAFCESDFVVIPAGIFLRYVSGKPVFLHNSTFPHAAMVTCAHCTAPRRMDAVRYEPVRLLTHYESEYGAAPKVEVPIGQEVTFIDPEYTTGRWVGIRGAVESNPFYEICRSQQDVRIHGDWKRLLNEVRDSHWVMVYGDYLKEIGYAAPRMGITWDDISKT